MFEYEKQIDVALSYCPLCETVHVMDVMELTVYTKLGETPVKYTEIVERCSKKNFQRTKDRTLKPVFEWLNNRNAAR